MQAALRAPIVSFGTKVGRVVLDTDYPAIFYLEFKKWIAFIS